MAGSFSIKVENTSAVRQALLGINQAKTTELVRAINAVAAKTRTKASKLIRQDVALKASYLNQPGRFVLRKATKETFAASIVARKRATRLASYGAKQITQKVKYPKRSGGDALRGIAAGSKSAGVSVRVKPGVTKKMPGAFLMPLNNGNGMGVFIRTGKGRGEIKHLYGPSVDQAFRVVLPNLTDGLADQVAAEFNKRMARLLE